MDGVAENEGPSKLSRIHYPCKLKSAKSNDMRRIAASNSIKEKEDDADANASKHASCLDIYYTLTYPGTEMLTEERSLKPCIMKCSWPRLLERDVQNACNGEFGTPKQVVSFCAPFDEHQNVTNEPFLKDAKPFLLPTPKESRAGKSSRGGQSRKDSGAPRSNDNPFVSDDSLPQGHGPFDLGAEASLPDLDVSGNPIPDHDMSVEDNKVADIQKTAIPKAVKPPTPDYRALVISISEDEGVSFIYCKDAVDLCDCLVHSMLGWLSMYQAGYLHRDISIGNLLKLVTPSERNEFHVKNAKDLALLINVPNSNETDVKPAVLDKANLLHEIINAGSPFDIPGAVRSLYKYAVEVENMAKNLGIGTLCKAIVTDGDLTAYVPTYFAEDRTEGAISGTLEFMSTAACFALEHHEPFLQSPVDDMYSFYWVAVWAALHNVHLDIDSFTATEKSFLRGLSGNTLERIGVSEQIGSCVHDFKRPTFSPILRSMWHMFGEWRKRLDKLTASWNNTREQSMKLDPTGKGLLQLFDYYAYCGVKVFLQIVEKHRPRLVAGDTDARVPALDHTGLPQDSNLNINDDHLD